MEQISSNNNTNGQTYAEKIIMNAINKLGIDKLPEDIKISTMTLVCKLDTIFNCKNIARFIDLSYDGILEVKCGTEENLKTNRSLVPKKQKSGKKKKKKKRVFYNQVSMYIMVKGKNKKPVSLKLFSNGAVQMTGCKTMDNAMDALLKIFPELLKTKAIIVRDLENVVKVVDKPFVTVPGVLNLKNVKNLKISMINSNFSMNFKIDRSKLYNLLLDEGYYVSYDPVKHAAVNVKFDHIEKTVSIFIFEMGPIIITGAQNCYQIADAYNFINKYLLINYNKIIKNDNLANANIIKYLDLENIKEENITNLIEMPNTEDSNNDSDSDDDSEI
jgi:TATA-box binding protein (TBP) (component of TFIID and TFIIIB)